MTDTRLPDRNLEPCNSVQEIIPLGTQKRPSSDGTSHPLSGRPRLEPTVILERTPKVISLLPKRTMPIKNLELGQREKSTAASLTGFNKSSRTDTDTLFSNCSVVVRKLQPNNINICSNKDVSFQPPVKKVPLQRSSSYNREREISLALSKELNENLRVFNSNSSANNQRHILPQPSHSRPASDSHTSFSNQKRPKSSVGTGERYAQHPDQRKDRPENKDHKHPVFSSMSSQKKLGTPHQKSTAEGRLSLSAKRRREASTDSEREIKRPCQGVQHKSSSSSTNSAQTFVRRAFVKSSSESLITLKERQSPRLPPPTPDTNKPTHPSSFLPRQLFKPSEFSSTFQHNTLTITGEPKDAKVAHANKNPKAPPSQPYLHKISPKSSTTFDSIETLFTPDPCVSPPKTNNKKINTESEGSVPSSHTSSSFSHKDGVKVRSPSLRPDPGTPSSAEQAVSCQMELDERTQFKVEQSRSPKANMPVPAASVKVEESGEKKYCPQWKDPLDIELGDELGDESRESCAISLSSSSDDEQLPSLREILDWSARVPVTPDKDAFSEPSTPAPKAAPEAVKTKAVSYRNTLEQMLQEKERYQRSKELERQLLESCEENLLNLSEDGENGESKEEDISHEQREFLQRFSVASCVIRDVHPGEEVFTPAKFGRLFSHQTLDLRRIGVTPQNRSQQILLQAHPEHVLSLISAGLLSKAYSSSPCQPEVTCWLFQMMSVHPNPVTSSRILQCLQSIAISAAEHIVEKHSQRFKVWVPTVQDVALVFINMGASFIGLFPLEDLQPSFTEGDLLEGFHPEETGQERLITDMNDDTTLPVHNFESVLRYLSLCTVLCPRAYTDEELLLLLTMVCRVGLETHFQLLPTGPFSLLLQSLLKNITHWEEQMFKTCQNLSDLSEDHHNLRRLIHLLPDSSRGKQLKRHLSVSIISKLLNHTCTYKPSGTDFKLSELKPFLPQMRPSSLLKGLRSARRTEDCDATLDQQAYYLCYSLLTLTNEASNFEFLPSDQRNDLLSLSSQLEKHIKCDIRESEKMLYRSKVKDFVARIYTKWQVLLQRTRPQEGKLYDYWKPPPEDEIPSSPRGRSCIGAQDEEASESEEETQSGESSGAESDDDARCKEKMEEEEQEEWPKECEDKIAQENEEEVGNSAETEEKSRVPKEQMMELDDENEKLQKDDEELFESHEDVMESDEDDDLMNREEELLKDEEPHEGDGKHIEGKNEALEELEDLLEKDGELLEMNEPIKEEGWEEMSGNSEESGKK